MKWIGKIVFTVTLCLIMISSSVWALPPSATPLYRGIDVSEYQGSIDFSAVREAGIQVVYIKSSEGFDYVDPYFRANYDGFRAQGIPVGFYHYVTAMNVTEAREQAAFFASVIRDTPPQCRLAVDFEVFNGLSPAEVTEITLAFLETAQAESGREMILYSDAYNARAVFGSELADYPLWVADYFVSEPAWNGTWSSWAGFQYSDAGRINGIAAALDLDYFTKDAFLSEHQDNIPAPEPTMPPTAGETRYLVQQGDTLSEIAARNGVSVASLVWLNHIKNPNLIYPGQVLRIPEEGRTASTYTVVRGDTLSEIAVRFGTSVAALAERNNIANPNLIFPGQVLQIPTETAAGSVYIVVRGDTLSEIAERFGTSVAVLAERNNIANPNLIFPGQRILLS